MSKPVLIIANPVSGGGQGQRLATELAQELERRAIPVQTELTQVDRTGRDIAAELEVSGYRCLAVIGGDGSLHDVLGGLRSFSTPIALLPAGTANVFATEVGIRKAAGPVAGMIERGDWLSARLFEANGERFFLFAGAGIDARIVRRVEAIRKSRDHRGGMSQWVVPGWHEFFRRPVARLTVEAEGQILEGLGLVLVTRVRSYAGGMKMPKHIDIRDSALHVLAFPGTSKLRFLTSAVRATLGAMTEGRDYQHIATEGEVRISSAAGEEAYHLDGSHAGEVPLVIRPTGLDARLVVPTPRAV